MGVRGGCVYVLGGSCVYAGIRANGSICEVKVGFGCTVMHIWVSLCLGVYRDDGVWMRWQKVSIWEGRMAIRMG